MSLEFIEAMSLTPTNKIEKYKLKERAASNRWRMWDREEPSPSESLINALRERHFAGNH